MTKHRAVISLGSNIDPETNIDRALQSLESIGHIIRKSKFIYTAPLLYKEQPKFLNGAVLLETGLNKDTLRQRLKNLETGLGRVHTTNKNGPRTIDFDIILFDGSVIDDDYYERDFLRKMVDELSEP